MTLHDLLLRFDSSPVIRLNRASALRHVRGPEAALAEVDQLRIGSAATTSCMPPVRSCSPHWGDPAAARAANERAPDAHAQSS
jgi:predicted RNA polymerase sigma factor